MLSRSCTVALKSSIAENVMSSAKRHTFDFFHSWYRFRYLSFWYRPIPSTDAIPECFYVNILSMAFFFTLSAMLCKTMWLLDLGMFHFICISSIFLSLNVLLRDQRNSFACSSALWRVNVDGDIVSQVSSELLRLWQLTGWSSSTVNSTILSVIFVALLLWWEFFS